METVTRDEYALTVHGFGPDIRMNPVNASNMAAMQWVDLDNVVLAQATYYKGIKAQYEVRRVVTR